MKIKNKKTLSYTIPELLIQIKFLLCDYLFKLILYLAPIDREGMLIKRSIGELYKELVKHQKEETNNG